VAAQGKPDRNQFAEMHPTRLLAKYAKGTGPQAVAAALERQGMRIRKHMTTVPNLMILEAAPAARAAGAQDLHANMRALRASGLFEYVEPDYRVQANLVPNDAAFTDGRLWGLLNTGQNGGVRDADIGVARAWDITNGSTNVIVAVIDTGIRYTHQDLASQMWRNPGETPDNGIDDDGDGYVDNVYGINAITGSGDPFDDHDHGTHVAGTIGASAGDSGPHVGVCWNVRLMACRFMAPHPGGGAGGLTSDAIECIDFAVSKGAKILNNSWGGGGYSQGLYDAIAAARSAGVLFVTAAGNSAFDTDLYTNYPSCYDLENVISVAALDRSDNLALFSNYGRHSVDLGAPGVDIFSSTAGSDSEYQYFNGTSMAAPHVSGVAALILARFPGITMAELRQRLIATAVPVPALAGGCVSGGRVNAYNALTASADGVLEVATSTSIPAPLLAGAHVGLYVSVSDLFPVTNATVTGQVMGGGELAFSNAGIIPDEIARDNTYSATLPVLANGSDLIVRLVISAPGKMTTTMTTNLAVRVPPSMQTITPGSVLAIAQQADGKIIIGGYFSVVNGVARTNIARLNADGSLDETWNPGISGGGVRTLALVGMDLFVIGDFTAMGGLRRSGIAKISTSPTATVDPAWNPAVPGYLVRAVTTSGSYLYLGGIQLMGNWPNYTNLVRIDISGTGAVDNAWLPHPDGEVYALAVDSTNLYVGGRFSRIGGINMNVLARVNTISGATDPFWNPNVSGPTRTPNGGHYLSSICALRVAGPALYVSGGFTNIGGLGRTNLAKLNTLDMGTADPMWNPNRDFNGYPQALVSSFALTGNDLYLCGGFTSIGGSTRTNLAKLNAIGSGNADPLWRANTDAWWQSVNALALSGSSILVGGSFSKINGESCTSLAKLNPLTGMLDDSFRAQVGFALPSSLLRFSVSEGLTLFGIPGGMYQIESTENLNQPINWLPLTTVTLSEYGMAVPGTRPVANGQRFYRTQLLLKP